MKPSYLKSTKLLRRSDPDPEDPLVGVANLFDLGLVFIVGLLLTLFTAYGLTDLFSEKSEFTILKKDARGQLEIITKKGRDIRAMRVTGKKAEGLGERLGTAYRLQDGTMVYVPEE
ncbi:DUF2149 domain-containing protein [Thermodesulforhabdus norvegica]|uniref:DUF2149 domain-containing protein n=1 Tax=Thermodesulforhabdus norvegica TaxID=39841 RepID=A0A1I4QX77_9BACT|nr:DUF2149 domain-containing protein [Thermodesulforhabdus norvegica]SFM44692.1 hypothetical protein SAMN05660836_00277 [Thermodesulforhabdus norvegica]